MFATHRARLGRTAAVFVAATALLIGGSACSTAGGGGDTPAVDSEYLVAPKEGPLTIGFANSFAGNAWRTQGIYELQSFVDADPENFTEVIITDANNSVDKQISDINDLLAKGVDIILINAASETALNSAVQRAWEQGVLVVSFDGAVSSEHGIIVNTDNSEFGKIGGEWLAEQMGGTGSVFTLDGVAGNPVSEARLTAASEALEGAGITIVGGAATDWDQAKGQAAASDLLAANPDVAGIYSQGGAATLGALNVIEQRGGDLIPIPGEGYNGFLKKWKELKDKFGWESIAPSQSPSIVVEALKVALQAIRGEDPGQKVIIPLPVITQDNLEENVKMDLPDDFFLPTLMTDEQIREYYNQ
jgi:ribose transport system substrate-binding protein